MRRWSSRKASALWRLAPASASEAATGSAPGPEVDGAPSFSDMGWHPRQFGFFGWGQIEGGGAGELGFGLIRFAGIGEGLAPFQMQPAPVGGVFFCFLEFLQRQVRLVL